MVHFFYFLLFSPHSLSVSLSSHLKLKLKLSSLKTLSSSSLSQTLTSLFTIAGPTYCQRYRHQSSMSLTHQLSQATDQPQTHDVNLPSTSDPRVERWDRSREREMYRNWKPKHRQGCWQHGQHQRVGLSPVYARFVFSWWFCWSGLRKKIEDLGFFFFFFFWCCVGCVLLCLAIKKL